MLGKLLLCGLFCSVVSIGVGALEFVMSIGMAVVEACGDTTPRFCCGVKGALR